MFKKKEEESPSLSKSPQQRSRTVRPKGDLKKPQGNGFVLGKDSNTHLKKNSALERVVEFPAEKLSVSPEEKKGFPVKTTQRNRVPAQKGHHRLILKGDREDVAQKIFVTPHRLGEKKGRRAIPSSTGEKSLNV